MSIWNRHLFRSTSVRLSLAFSGLISASFVVIGVVIWWVARDTAESELRQDIELELAAIRTELEQEGLGPTIAAVNARAALPGALLYRLEDSDGARLAGNREGFNGATGWHLVSDSDASRDTPRRGELLIYSDTLPGGLRLSVGDDLRRARAVQNAVLRTLASVGAISVFVCLVVGVLTTRRALGRIRTLSATFEKVAAGDITARYPANRSTSDIDEIGRGVNTMLDRIEKLVMDVRRVSRDLAHDLRTPLTHLQQRIEQARNAHGAVARAEALEDVQHKAAEILRIFDAIVRLTEIEAGTGKKRFRRIDLAAVIEKVVDAYRPDIEESGHVVEIRRLDSCIVLGDEDLLSQAVANLVENAMRHTPPGTRIELQVFDEGSIRGFEVRDDGPGIPPDAYDVIREPFTRLDSSRTTPGSGLGLSLVDAIVGLHDAQLELSDAESGLRVRVLFA